MQNSLVIYRAVGVIAWVSFSLFSLFHSPPPISHSLFPFYMLQLSLVILQQWTDILFFFFHYYYLFIFSASDWSPKCIVCHVCRWTYQLYQSSLFYAQGWIPQHQAFVICCSLVLFSSKPLGSDNLIMWSQAAGCTVRQNWMLATKLSL